MSCSHAELSIAYACRVESSWCFLHAGDAFGDGASAVDGNELGMVCCLRADGCLRLREDGIDGDTEDIAATQL